MVEQNEEKKHGAKPSRFHRQFADGVNRFLLVPLFARYLCADELRH